MLGIVEIIAVECYWGILEPSFSNFMQKRSTLSWIRPPSLTGNRVILPWECSMRNPGRPHSWLQRHMRIIRVRSIPLLRIIRPITHHYTYCLLSYTFGRRMPKGCFPISKFFAKMSTRLWPVADIFITWLSNMPLLFPTSSKILHFVPWEFAEDVPESVEDQFGSKHLLLLVLLHLFPWTASWSLCSRLF